MYDAIAVTGRFQPFHVDHLDLVVHGLSLAHHVVIGITNPDHRSLVEFPENNHRHLATANPFTFFERAEIIRSSLEAADVTSAQYTVVPFPLDEPEVWHEYIPATISQLVRIFSSWEEEKIKRLRAGGYEVNIIHGNPGTKVSGTDIRNAMLAGESWQHLVSPGALKILREYSEEDLATRLSPHD